MHSVTQTSVEGVGKSPIQFGFQTQRQLTWKPSCPTAF